MIGLHIWPKYSVLSDGSNKDCVQTGDSHLKRRQLSQNRFYFPSEKKCSLKGKNLLPKCTQKGKNLLPLEQILAF